jgi:hypothetical protein
MLENIKLTMEEFEIKLYVGSIINWNVPCKWNDFKGKFKLNIERGNEKEQIIGLNKDYFVKSRYRYFLYDRSCILIYKPNNTRIYISLPKNYCDEIKEVIDDNSKAIENIINKLHSFDNIDTKKDYSFAVNLLSILITLDLNVSILIDHVYNISSNEFRVNLWFDKYIPNYHEDVEKMYLKVNGGMKLLLWLYEIYGTLDYLEYSKYYYGLNDDVKKIFNKKVKEHAILEQFRTFIDQIPDAVLLITNLETKKYKCKWRNIYFKEEKIQIFLSQHRSTSDYPCSFSKVELNLLTQEYLANKRLDDIIVSVNNDNSIVSIEGLESIETKIIFAEIRKNGSIESRQKITNEEVIRMIHNVAERNKCIRFLNEQNSPYNVVDIQELVTEDYGGLRRDISFLYCLPDNLDNIYLIWESVEFQKSKATHIFKCKSFEIEDCIDIIKEFLESTIHSRSLLNSYENDDMEQKKELNYFGRVIHDSKEYGIWEERIKNILPFLK